MNKLINCRCFANYSHYAPVVLRIVAGIIFAVHGWQKLSSGVDMFSGFLDRLNVPLPLFFAYVVTFVELLGGIALIIGFMAHWASKFLLIDMAVATLLVHAPNGFFISKGGIEFTALLFAAALSIALSGAGPVSIDNLLAKKKEA